MSAVGTNLTSVMLMTMKTYQLTCVVTGLRMCVRHSDMGRHRPYSSHSSSRMSSMGAVVFGSPPSGGTQCGGKVDDLGRPGINLYYLLSVITV